MEQPKRWLFAGLLEQEFAQELRVFQKENLVKRLWAQDVSLWPSEENGLGTLARNLEFLHFPEQISRIAEWPPQIETQVIAEGLTDRVLIGFGSPHHICATLQNIFPIAPPLRWQVLLDCHPDGIRLLEKQIDVRKAFFVLVNKSGYQVEDHALFLYFEDVYKMAETGPPGRHFAAVSEPNSFLTSVAIEHRFRAMQELPAGIISAYCSLAGVAALLVVLANLEVEVVRIAAQEMKQVYAEGTPAKANPASELGAFLAATAASGRPFLTFLSSRKLEPFAHSLCGLVGASLGRGEAGLFPIAQVLPCETRPLEENGSFVLLQHAEESDEEFKVARERMSARGVPYVEVKISEPLDLLPETFRWQIATVLAASRIGLNPFDHCDGKTARKAAAEMLNQLSPKNDTLQRRPRIDEESIQLFAESPTRQEISQLNLTECLLSFFEARHSAAFLGVYAFLHEREETREVFQRLRDLLSQTLQRPVFLAHGPRGADTYGYFLREGAPRGLHLMITAESEGDLAIPGASYTFGQLYRAMALGHFEALSGIGALALRLHLASESSGPRTQLENLVTQALRRVKP